MAAQCTNDEAFFIFLTLNGLPSLVNGITYYFNLCQPRVLRVYQGLCIKLAVYFVCVILFLVVRVCIPL